MHIESQDLTAISRLWRELAEFPAGQAPEARAHCFARLGEIIGAADVLWVGATRAAANDDDLLGGWRPRAVARQHASPNMDRQLAEIVRQMDDSVVDPMTLANVAHAGRMRAFLRPELVTDHVWERTPLVNEILRPNGIGDRVIGVHSIDRWRESHVALDRGPKDRPFGERERDLLHLFLSGAHGYHREQFLAQGLTGPKLTPREREALALLLTDLGEREIGERLGLTWRTTHQYTVSICRKFGVRGRFGLMSLWLRHPPRRPPAS